MNQKWIKLMNKPKLNADDYTWINLEEIRRVIVNKATIATAEEIIKETYVIEVINKNGVAKSYYGDIHIVQNFEKVMMSGVI